MAPKKVFSSEFEKTFTGEIVLTKVVEDKLFDKHKVYRDDLHDALGDPYMVVMRSKQKSPVALNREKSAGKVYEILYETEFGKVLFVIARLFPDGKLLIITVYWADEPLQKIYYQESEVVRND